MVEVGGRREHRVSTLQPAFNFPETTIQSAFRGPTSIRAQQQRALPGIDRRPKKIHVHMLLRPASILLPTNFFRR